MAPSLGPLEGISLAPPCGDSFPTAEEDGGRGKRNPANAHFTWVGTNHCPGADASEDR
jgi:hypothetical protein